MGHVEYPTRHSVVLSYYQLTNHVNIMIMFKTRVLKHCNQNTQS